MYSTASAFTVVTLSSTPFSFMFLSAVSKAGLEESTAITEVAPPLMRFEEYYAVDSDDDDDNGDDCGYDSGDDNNGNDSGYMS
jgi:hypothetical protein